MNLSDLWAQNKTLLLGFLQAALGVAYLFNFVTLEQAAGVYVILQGGSVFTAKLGVNRIEHKVDEVNAKADVASAKADTTNANIKAMEEECK